MPADLSCLKILKNSLVRKNSTPLHLELFCWQNLSNRILAGQGRYRKNLPRINEPYNKARNR